MSDETLDRLHALTAHLTECLAEAAEVRARLAKARHDVTMWPDLQPASPSHTDRRGASDSPTSKAAGRRVN